MCGHASGVHFKRKSVWGEGRALVCSDLEFNLERVFFQLPRLSPNWPIS